MLVISEKAFGSPVKADAEVNKVLREVAKEFPEIEAMAVELASHYPNMGKMAALRLIAAIGLLSIRLENDQPS